MPGIIIFKRRWSVGSDDMILPSFILLLIHTSWLVILSLLISSVRERDWRYPCMSELYEHTVGYLIILSGCTLIEFFICWVSSRGTIMNPIPRASMQYLLYVRFGILLVEIAWLCIGLVWLWNNYDECNHGNAKEFILVITVCNMIVITLMLMIGWCSYDSAGRSWVKMKRYQNSLKENQSKYRYKRSGSTHRNWRHRKAVRQYQDSWNRRCHLLFCCLANSDKHQSSFAEIAKLLSEFFRDLDVVPSDVVAGLIIIRKQQKLQRELIAAQCTGGVYEFLSGVPISRQSRFLDAAKTLERERLRTIAYYFDYAIAVYGWPMFMMMNKTTGCCRLCPYLNCSNCCLINAYNCCAKKQNQQSKEDEFKALDDNCCSCNYAAMRRILKSKDCELIYSTYHVEIGEPPFFVALDHTKKTIVISVRGTLSLQDIITDLNAEGDLIPTNPPREQWLAHKGMIEAASYIHSRLVELRLIERALAYGQDCESARHNTRSYTLVLVGHSLGAGTVSILAIMLKKCFPDLVCYSFSPPGGLLSLEAAHYSRGFITSVVLGKDIVPRLGLHQMETLRFDLINAVKECQLPKWKVIGSTICCCPILKRDRFLVPGARTSTATNADSQSIGELSSTFLIGQSINENNEQSLSGNADDATAVSLYSKSEKELSAHPNDSSIALTVHQPLYPPGEIIHIVRSQVEKGNRNTITKQKIYKALCVDNVDFDQIIITPAMISDHMPTRIMEALFHLLEDDNFKDSLSRPLLSDHNVTSPLVLYEYGSGWSGEHIQPVAVQPRSKPQQDYPPLKTLRELCSECIPKKDHETVVDLAADEWLGMAPLATPEMSSETSSICSKLAMVSSNGTPTRNSQRHVQTVSELIQAAMATSQNRTLPTNESLSKLDLELNIDVNALFEKWDQHAKIHSEIVRAEINRTISPTLKEQEVIEMPSTDDSVSNNSPLLQNQEIKDQQQNSDPLTARRLVNKPLVRASSLRRANSISSGKRVTFDSTTLGKNARLDRSNGSASGASGFISRMTGIRRVNSERPNKRKIMGPFSGARTRLVERTPAVDEQLASGQSNIAKEKVHQPILEASSITDQLPTNAENKIDEESENRTNERLEKELKELLGHSISFSDPDLSQKILQEDQAQ